MKKKIIFLLLILIVNISFLFSGPPDPIGPNSYCPHQYVRLNALMGVPVNCDEFVFIGAAVRPAYLIEQGFQRQNRPGYIILGTTIGYTIYYVLSPFHTTLKSFASKKLSGQFSAPELEKAVLYGSIYSGFILINIVVLFLSMLLFEKCLLLATGEWKNSRWLLWICLAMLISNQVDKTFFWTAHQQMFTVFTPIACLYAGLTVLNHPSSKRSSLIIAFISGLLLLVYGNFLLLLPVILFSYLLRLRKQKKQITGPVLVTILTVIIIFFLPTAFWIACLRLTGVSYYNHEISQFRHFVWITDSWQHSVGFFLRQLLSNTTEFLKTSGSLLLTLLFLAAARLSVPRQPEKTAMIKTSQAQQVIKPILLVSMLLFLLFLWSMGAYADRLTYSLAPFLIFAAVCQINEKKLSIKNQWVIASLVCLIHLYTVFFNAPHLSQKLFFQ